MQSKSLIYTTLICMLFMTFTACEKETLQKEEIPITIKTDFITRYPLAEVTAFHTFSGDLRQLEFINEDQNKASVWYVNEDWKMTHTQVDNIKQLPLKALFSFGNSPYADANIIDIYKTEREGINKSLYTLHFKFPWKKTPNVEHYIFINEDGLFLKTISLAPNNPSYFVTLSKDHFDFISRKYIGAEIRGYINNAGAHEYFILHEDTIKYVSFGAEEASEYGFWKETRYELNLDVDIPDNVINQLQKGHPGFTYSNIYYIESPRGNAYLFQDKNHDQELGYYIGESI